MVNVKAAVKNICTVTLRQEVRAGDVEIYLYIDVLFFLNCFMDFLLLYLLKGILKKPSSVKQIAWGAFAGGVTGCLEALLWKYPPWVTMTASFGAAGLMVTIAFGWSGWKELIKRTGSLYFLAVLAGGLMEFLYQYTRAGFYLIKVMQGNGIYAMPLFTWLFLAAGTFLMVRGLWQFADEMIKERANKYPVVLADQEVVVKTTGYLDTGNCLTEPVSGQGVQIVTERIWNLFQTSPKKRVIIPYHTIGNPYGVMEGMKIERMEVWQGGIRGKKSRIKIIDPWIAKAPYGFARDGSYEVLLHGESRLFGEQDQDKKGGITDGDQSINTKPFSI